MNRSGFRYSRKKSNVRPRYTIFANGRYLSGGAGTIAWSHSFREVNNWAFALGGDVVDADEFVLNFENQ